jgi:hypothetical protein
MGSCGEYSDRREWNVAAYLSEKTAKEHAENADAKAKILYTQYKDACYDIPAGSNEYDPQMSSDYTGTRYDMVMVSLRDAPLELKAWLKIQQ